MSRCALGFRWTTLGLMLVAVWVLPTASAAPPDHASWQLTFEDEFNGEAIDGDVWSSQASIRGGGRLEGRWPENNVIEDGILHQITRHETPPRGGKDWSTAHIWTTSFRQQYGYFECRMRYGRYLNNAFWLFRPPSRANPAPNFEIDINEGHTPREVAMCLHFFVEYARETGSGPDRVMYSRGKRWHAPVDLDRDYHLYAVEWDAEEIVWYTDGKPVRRLQNPNCHAPVDIRLSTVIQQRALERDAGDLNTMDGVRMSVDWVRVYRKVRDLREPTGLPELEACPVPRPELRSSQVSLTGQRAAVHEQGFENCTGGALPIGWEIGDGRPKTIAAPQAMGAGQGRVLALQPGDYAFLLFEQPVTDRLDVRFDYSSPKGKEGLLFVTVGQFDKTNPELRKSSYYTGDIGPYIHWRNHFIHYYTEVAKWQPFARGTAGERASTRFTLDIGKRVFDYYSGNDGGVFRSGGLFRGTQKAAHGIGFRHRGKSGVVYVDNVRIERIGE
ncbi:MAG: glycoside hydrolase family 16 protein [Lentisphaerae bacterium]|jgi:beta-glucanase (GH16 family)|nr:glycoside hydrolase family 16 protein [Lentisphaerota bacterium]MBT4821621.1 glycoside hydrolase family 16 protein [Lentisphaerota bacterium]MBT5612777.1 glycoside hydrolase family 16 protein [Lentisphaerota bacterium]MBT7059959.1 glycoside hydrolase family 16 protein [Lentisphaerota bacterium]MBT7842141.1 glycoside hydrolase family 16 protein [Lentisphaerota bacterium]